MHSGKRGERKSLMEYMDVRQASTIWKIPERRITALVPCRQDPRRKESGKAVADSGTIRSKPLDGQDKSNFPRRTDAPAVRQTTTHYTETGANINASVSSSKPIKNPPYLRRSRPYRICPLGAHSDHQLGKITGFAIDKGIHIAYGPKQNGVIEIASLQFPKRAQWHVSATPERKQNDWADHLRGATIALNSRYPLRTGLCAIIDGELPIGGLSSSAAVIITFLSALCTMNRIVLTPAELIEISKEAENRYVGVSCGKLDQSCEVYCKKDH